MERSRSRLVLKTANTSWIDVRDVYDNKLIYETVPAGREIPLEGMAPFKVFLGNAEGVQIFVEGKEFNFSRFKRGQTARFSLNVEESNRSHENGWQNQKANFAPDSCRQGRSRGRCTGERAEHDQYRYLRC